MNDQPPPILVVGREEHGQKCFAIRFNPLGKYTDKDLTTWLGTDDPYVIYSEISKKKQKLHYHVMLFAVCSIAELRKEIQVFLATYFPVREVGDGNKQYNLAECRDQQKYLTYTVKDGTPVANQFINPNAISFYAARSYPKYSKESFASEFDKLRDQFKNSTSTRANGWTLEYDTEWFMNRMIELKSKYRQPIDINYIYRVSLTQEFHKRPERIKDYVGSFLNGGLNSKFQ